MARSFSSLAVALLIAVPIGSARDENDGDKRHRGRKSDKGHERRHGPDLSPEFENVRKALEALTPDQQKRFHENFLRWSNMSPEAKKALRDRDEYRRKRMFEDIEEAIREAGLTLDRERRGQFVKRYIEERRKIEDQLRKDLEAKRKPLVAELIAKLKVEFGNSGSATGAPDSNANRAAAATPAQ